MTIPIAPQQFAVADIVVRKRLRPVTPEGVAKMVTWLSEGGQKTPISVRVDGDGAHPILVAGAHRLAAAKELGWPTIVCVFEEMDEVDAQLWEIAENLHRNELTALERDEQIALWIALSQQRKKPRQVDEVSKGGRGKTGGVSKASRELSISEPDARRALQVALLPDEAKQIARESGLDGNRSALLEAAAHETPEAKVAAMQLRAAVKDTSLDSAPERKALERLPEADRAELIKRAQSHEKVSAKARTKKNARNAREKVLGELQAPTGRFGCMVEDYEWDHVVWSRDTGMDRHAGNHYPVSDDAHTAEEIVKKTADRFAIADDNCVLFMWSTVQHLAIAMDVLRQRGFEYVSHYIWGKDKIGLGYWNRNKHEILLIGVKGHIDCPAPGDQWDSLLMSPRLEHSQKPDIFLEMIEGYFPTLPKMELNARRRRKGWKAWGLDAPEDEDDSDPSRAAEAGQGDPATIAMGAGLSASVARDGSEDHVVDVNDMVGRIEVVVVGPGNAFAEIVQLGDVSEDRLEDCIAGLLMRTPPVPADKITRIDALTGKIIAPVRSIDNGGGSETADREEGDDEIESDDTPGGDRDPSGREDCTLDGGQRAAEDSFIPGSIFDPETDRLEASVTAEEEAEFFPDEVGEKEPADDATDRPADNARPPISAGGRSHEVITDHPNDMVGKAGAVGMSSHPAVPVQSRQIEDDGEDIPDFLRRSPENPS